MHNILISNIGFGKASPESLKTLQKLGKVNLNTDGIRFSEKDFIEKLADAQILIAGTEKVTKIVMEHAPNLKLIARIGVGVDNIDLNYAREKNISICYTPDAPAISVPEFTISLILNLLKGIAISDRKMHEKIWHRPMGRMLSSMKFGIIGAGKIGSKVIELLHLISPTSKIYYYDPYIDFIENAIKSDLEELFTQSNIISLHLPLNNQTKNLIGADFLCKMKIGGYLINTSRGGIIDETALYDLLKNSHLAGAAIDVFETEPYQGILTELDNCILTSHLGSLTEESRTLMEEQVVEDIIHFIKNEPLARPFGEYNFSGN